MDTKDEVLRLRSSIRTADAAYYGMQQPVISDAEYDALMNRLRKLEADHPELVTADSPTQRIGAPVEIVKKIERSIPMLSLDNVFNIEQYTKFHGGVVDQINADEYSVEPKIDGLALELVYVDGVLKSAATRGDGMVGEDVTHAVRTIKDVPLQLMPTPYGIPPYLEVRGEAYMTKSAFLTYNAEAVARGQKPFANPRNAAAGALRLLDPWAVSKRRLSFYVYGTGLYKWPGYMDTISTDDRVDAEGLGLTSVIKLTCAKAGLARSRNRDGLRMTNEQQQAQYPGDTFFSYVRSLIEQPSVWLTKRFQEQ